MDHIRLQVANLLATISGKCPSANKEILRIRTLLNDLQTSSLDEVWQAPEYFDMVIKSAAHLQQLLLNILNKDQRYKEKISDLYIEFSNCLQMLKHSHEQSHFPNYVKDMNENSLVVKENLLRQLRLETQKLKKAEEDYDDLYAGMAETLRAKDDEIAALLDKLKAADDLLAFSQVSKPGSPRQLAISGVASNIILTPPKAENPNLKLAEENEQLKDEIKGLRLQLDKAKQAGLKQDDNYQLLMNEVSKLQAAIGQEKDKLANDRQRLKTKEEKLAQERAKLDYQQQRLQDQKEALRKGLADVAGQKDKLEGQMDKLLVEMKKIKKKQEKLEMDKDIFANQKAVFQRKSVQHIESQKNLEAETDKLKKTVDRLEAEKVKAEEAKREQIRKLRPRSFGQSMYETNIMPDQELPFKNNFAGNGPKRSFHSPPAKAPLPSFKNSQALPRDYGKNGNEDELWRFLLVQATTLEEYLRDSSEEDSNLDPSFSS